MTASFRTVENWADYTFRCPEGKWTATVDSKAWGKGGGQNLILCFSEVGAEQKYRAGGKTSSCVFRKLGPSKNTGCATGRGSGTEHNENQDRQSSAQKGQ